MRRLIWPLLITLAIALAGMLAYATAYPVANGAAHRSLARDGHLAGIHLGPRAVAALAHDVGFRDDDLFVAVAVCGAESWMDTRAYNDNLATIAALVAGQLVMNVETGEKVTVLDPARGQIKLSDGEVVFVPLTVEYVVSRDVGLWQINIPASQIGTPTEAALYNVVANAQAAYALWQKRGWQPWAAYNSDVYLNDTYRSWAMLGVANLWGAKTNAAALLAGKTPKVRVPWINIPQLRLLYPEVPLG